MARRPTERHITEWQWLQMHLRLAALEQSGWKLNCRFDFPKNTGDSIVCSIYFTDDDSNPMGDIPEEERIEIYEGWVSFGMSVIQRAIELAELPSNLAWKPTLQFILHENCGMGTAVVHRVNKPFIWPEESRRGKA